jgi:hypothetical protein
MRVEPLFPLPPSRASRAPRRAALPRSLARQVRVVAAPLESRRKDVALDDAKSKAGLGELYEQDYVRQVRTHLPETVRHGSRRVAAALLVMRGAAWGAAWGIAGQAAMPRAWAAAPSS